MCCQLHHPPVGGSRPILADRASRGTRLPLAFRRVSSFSAVVMAAGQGTRMRSALPKVLHELCGRPMVAWPVRAAQEAGAQRVVVVGSPGIDLAPALPDGVQTAVQPVADGTGGAVLAALAQTVAGAPVVVLSGDVPLVSAQAISELVAGHAASGRSSIGTSARVHHWLSSV